jgi:5-methylcytosine-specific restriction endonuclease McrA
MIATRFGSWKKALVLVAAIHASDTGTPAKAETAVPWRNAISPRRRFLVFKRDLYQCRICRRAGVELELDHVIPVSLGGSDSMDNLQTLCVPCNRGKSNSMQ